MTEKTVSVYINAFNAESFIEETVRAILDQSYKNIKLVVINDCSTDTTLPILERIDDDRLSYYSLPRNSHIAATLNEGLKYMDGDYIAHCDADDVWEKDKIQKQVDFLESHPEYGACFTRVRIIDGDGNFNNDLFPVRVFDIPNASRPELLSYFCKNQNHFHHSSFFARREIVEAVGKYDLSMPVLHDYDYWLRLLLVTPVYIIEEPLIRYRVHGKNNSIMDEEKTNSHDTECMRAVKKCFDACPDELFLEAFKDELHFAGKHTKEEIEIEKAFIISRLQTPVYSNPALSVEILAKMINDPVYSKILEEKFSFNQKNLNYMQRSRTYHKPSEELRLLAEIDELGNKLLDSTNEINRINARLSLIENGLSWRLTKPLRVMSTAARNYASKHPGSARPLILTKSFLRGGPKAVRQKKIDLAAMPPPGLVVPHTISKSRRKDEESYKFEKNVKISILVPLYNTPQVFLKEMIDSVVGQTYKNWELCLADGSEDGYEYVGEYCKKLAKNDSRIKYQKLAENRGISGNTNSCLAMATGEYIALFDHDDILHPSALFEVMKRICDGADYIYTDEVTFLGDDLDHTVSHHYKPDFAFDNLISNNYICHFSVFKATLVTSDELFRTKYDGSQDHDLILRLTDAAQKIEHIPQILYFWRSHKNSVALDINSKRYAIEAGQNAVHDFLESKGMPCTVESSPAFPTIYKINFKLKERPKVSIIIPNRDHYKDISRCIDSILALTSYTNYEIIVVDNQTTDSDVIDYYNYVSTKNGVKIMHYDEPFNYSAVNNYAAANSSGKYLLFLNNDTKVISPDWIERLLMYAQRDDVGAVGAKLFYENDTVQHGGIILGIGVDRVAGHSHYEWSRTNVGYMGKMFYAQDVSAVTAACLMVSRKLFDEVNGFDEALALAFNDVDFCLKLRKLGKLIVFNPFCELYHYESASRGSDKSTENKERFKKEKELFLEKWGETIKKGDPYYNPNLSLDISYSLAPQK